MHENYWNMSWGVWLFFLLVCLMIYFMFKNSSPLSGSKAKETPLDILIARFAKGEITKEQFEEIKQGIA